ncbi:CDP-alcohol phosphatidyltransferase family protein [Hyphomicrobiales bacterium]|nr:CDP-alcohol phosphatidyltransferase family protein [Hyphomicrobiales bacterium]
MNFANIITVFRLLLTPIIIWLIFSSYYLLGLIFFVLSGLSDALDGFIAKQFNQKTLLGSYLDPIADKALIVSSILALGYVGAIPPWLIILIVSRDLAILGAVIISWLIESSLKIEPIISSKINTFLQIFYIGLILFNLSTRESIYNLDSHILPFFAILIAFSTLSSWFNYLMIWLKNMGIIGNMK